MTYAFGFDDNDKDAREAVEQLNDACKGTKELWRMLAEEMTDYIRLGMTGDIITTLLSALNEILKEDSGAELFYFVTPPTSTKVMARRLCAALRLVAESLYEEGIEDFVYEKSTYASDIYKGTKWAAHCPKSGTRRNLKTHDVISAKSILDITKLVVKLKDLVIGILCACAGEINYNNNEANKAFTWYKRAAEAGNAIAQFNLGVCYDNGEGVAVNKIEADKWYERAAESGYAPAVDARRLLREC